MKPVKLKIEGFLSYKESTTIDFSDLGLFAITGATGAGKTSIVDAIVYALYGKTPRFDDKKDSKNLLSKLSNRLLVEFTFYINGHYYTVERSYSADDKSNSTSIKSAKPHQKATILKDGKILFDKDKNNLINKEIEKILKIDYDTFTKVILLPQGEFAKFIKPDEPSDRRKLVMKLTGFDKIEKIKDKALIKFKNINDEINNIKFKLETLKTQDSLEELQSKLFDTENTLKALKETLTPLQERHQKAFRKKELQEYIFINSKKLQDMINKEQDMNLLKSKIDYLEQYVGLKSDLERYVELSKKQNILKDNLSSQKSIYTSKKQEYETFLETFEQIKQKNDELPQKEERLSRGKQIISKLSEAIMVEKDIANLKTKLDDKSNTLTNIKNQLDKTLTELNTLKQSIGLEHIDDIIKEQQQRAKELGELNAALQQLEKAKSQRLGLLKNIETKKKTLSSEQERLNRLNQELEKEKDNIIYQYSNIIKSFLKDQDKCPVCGGIYHEKEHIESISSRYDELLENINKSKEYISKLEFEIHSQETQLKDIQNTIEIYEEKLSNKESLENELSIINKIQDKLKQKINLEKDIENTIKNVNELQSLIDEKIHILSNIEKELINLNLQDKYLVNKENTYKRFEEKIKEIENDIKQTKAEFEKLKDKYNDYNKVLELLEKDISHIEEDIKNTEQELYSLSQKLKNIEDQAKTLEELEKLEDYKNKYITYQQNIKALKDDINSKQEELNSILEEESLETIEKLIYDTNSNIENLNQEKGSLLTRIETIKINQEKAKELSSTLEELMAENEVYKQINTDLQGRNFQDYISKKIIENLLKYANYYADITGFPYAFLLENEDDIFVENTFGKRPIKSLSGGETFISSLCFALALGEAIGVTNIRSLFIDEGFGTLDRETLDRVGNAIELLSQKTDKVIGIITHVEELANRCPSKLTVTKINDASHVETNTQE